MFLSLFSFEFQFGSHDSFSAVNSPSDGSVGFKSWTAKLKCTFSPSLCALTLRPNKFIVSGPKNLVLEKDSQLFDLKDGSQGPRQSYVGRDSESADSSHINSVRIRGTSSSHMRSLDALIVF